MRTIVIALATLALAACDTAVPNSGVSIPNTGSGVGFGDYAQYQRAREAQLTGEAPSGPLPTTVRPPVPVAAAPLDASGDAIEARAAITARAANSGVTPLEASPSNPPPRVVTNSAGISGENDFDAVSSRRDIAADAALIAQNRAQYQIIRPTDLPSRPGTNRPNIVQYALQTNNPVGVALYSRSRLRSQDRHQRACASYTSADLAQEDFLAMGGPERDRGGLDPDGDGFACSWTPTPFRAVRGG